MPNTSAGLTQAGLSRLNQSIEAFIYCVQGEQVNVKSSILGDGGRAKEAQSEFLTLLEGAIRQPHLAKSVSRYQLANDEAKVRLCYEARRQQRCQHKHKKASLRLMGGGYSKVNPPNSHPSNPFHKKKKTTAPSPGPSP